MPAYFNDNQRQATKDAGRIAGLDVLRILNEPTAAALAYGFGRDVNQRVVVYDLGGGTFDVSILEIGKDVFEVLSTAGDTYLGGDDFDDRIMNWLAEDFLARTRLDLRQNKYCLQMLKEASERAKIDVGARRARRRSTAPASARTPTAPCSTSTQTLTQDAVQPHGDGPRAAHLQGVRRGAAERAHDRGRRRRGDPGGRPHPAADHPQLGAALLPEGAHGGRRPRPGRRRWARRCRPTR